MTPLRLERDGAPLIATVTVADTFRSRLVGLLGRSSIDPGEGLWFPGETSLHMVGMRFPVTVLWLSHPDPGGSREVMGVSRLRPWRSLGVGPRGTHGALECHPSVADRVQPGDRVTLVDPAAGDRPA